MLSERSIPSSSSVAAFAVIRWTQAHTQKNPVQSCLYFMDRNIGRCVNNGDENGTSESTMCYSCSDSFPHLHAHDTTRNLGPHSVHDFRLNSLHFKGIRTNHDDGRILLEASFARPHASHFPSGEPIQQEKSAEALCSRIDRVISAFKLPPSVFPFHGLEKRRCNLIARTLRDGTSLRRRRALIEVVKAVQSEEEEKRNPPNSQISNRRGRIPVSSALAVFGTIRPAR